MDPLLFLSQYGPPEGQTQSYSPRIPIPEYTPSRPVKPPKGWATQKEKRAEELGLYDKPNWQDKYFYFEDKSGHKQSDWLPKDPIYDIALEAKRHGVDPLRGVSTFVAETGAHLGKANPGRLTYRTDYDYTQKIGNPYRAALNNTLDIEETIRGPGNYSLKYNSPLDLSSEDFSNALEYSDWKASTRLAMAKLRAMQLDPRFKGNELAQQQAYSGTGNTLYKGQKNPSGQMAKDIPWFGGKDLNNYDVWKEKPQANKTLALEAQLGTYPEVQGLIEEANQAQGPDEFFTKFLPELQRKILSNRLEKDQPMYPYGAF
jgi:hypothetical protein